MELVKCDRCGKVYRGSKSPREAGWIYSHIHTWDDVTNFDLCPKCAPKFINYAKKYLITKKKRR